MSPKRQWQSALSGPQRRRLLAILVGASLVALVPFVLTWRVEAHASRTLLETNESRYYLPSEPWLEPLSLGYREAAAGIIWTRLLVYFGEQHEVRGRFEHLEHYLWAVTTLDPYFYRAYTWGCISPLYNGTLITRSDVEMSLRLLARGLRFFPDDGELHYLYGFQYYFELAPLVEGEEHERARRVGIDEICTAAMLGGGPPYLPLVCSNFNERRGLDRNAADHLLAILPTVTDELTRTRIEARIERLMHSPDAAFRLFRQIDEFRLRWHAEMPYVPPGFYAIAGPRPPVPLSDEYDIPTHLDEMIEAEYEELFESPPGGETHDVPPEADGDAGPPGDEEIGDASAVPGGERGGAGRSSGEEGDSDRDEDDAAQDR